MIVDMESNKKKIVPKLTGLFLRRRKLNISHVFISQPYSKVPKTIRLNGTHYFIMKVPNKRELQQIASNILLTLILKISRNFIKNILKNHSYF